MGISIFKVHFSYFLNLFGSLFFKPFKKKNNNNNNNKKQKTKTNKQTNFFWSWEDNTLEPFFLKVYDLNAGCDYYPGVIYIAIRHASVICCLWN